MKKFEELDATREWHDEKSMLEQIEDQAMYDDKAYKLLMEIYSNKDALLELGGCRNISVVNKEDETLDGNYAEIT